MKPLVLPWWLKIASYIGCGGFILVALFQFLSGFLPPFGSITVYTPAGKSLLRGYKVDCSYNQYTNIPTITFRDQAQSRERALILQPGTKLNSNPDTFAIEEVWIDKKPLTKNNCSLLRGIIANHAGGRGRRGPAPKVFEYVLSLDCEMEGERLVVDLHDYSCGKQ